MMRYRYLGKTGIRISTIGFGAWAIGGASEASGAPLGWGRTSDDESLAAIRRARELGVNFFDTSDSYGFGRSESLLGIVLSRHRDDVVIATKVGVVRTSAGELKKDFSRKHILHAVDGSLKRLRTDYIDLYQLHNPTLDDLRREEIQETMDRLQDAGKIRFENIEEGATVAKQIDDVTGLSTVVVIDAKRRTAGSKGERPQVKLIDPQGNEVKIAGSDHSVNISFPVGALITVRDNQDVFVGEVLARIPQESQKTRDITGGLPRVAELFEARSPKDAGLLAEVTGTVSFGKDTKGKQRLVITDLDGVSHEFLIPKEKQVLAHDGQVVNKGEMIVDGPADPHDILRLKGIEKLANYIVNEVQDVYRLQGVKINDKHIEVIVRQMMRKVTIEDQGDTQFLEKQIVNKKDFMEENDKIYGMKVIMDSGDSENLIPGQIISARKLRDENSMLKRKDMKLAVARDAVPATSVSILQGITRASLQTDSFISAASFQETTKVLANAATEAKVDYLLGLKENVVMGHLIPAGSGLKKYQSILLKTEEPVVEKTEDKEVQATQ